MAAAANHSGWTAGDTCSRSIPRVKSSRALSRVPPPLSPRETRVQRHHTPVAMGPPAHHQQARRAVSLLQLRLRLRQCHGCCRRCPPFCHDALQRAAYAGAHAPPGRRVASKRARATHACMGVAYTWAAAGQLLLSSGVTLTVLNRHTRHEGTNASCIATPPTCCTRAEAKQAKASVAAVCSRGPPCTVPRRPPPPNGCHGSR